MFKEQIFLILNNIRSAHNVGSIFRTADAVGISKIYLCGITPTPPHSKISKTALGAEKTVPKDILLIVGNEISGLNKKILSYTDKIVEIPMFGKKGSLNVAVTTGVALYRLIES